MESEATSLVALLQIIGIDIILSGDNALVIALACRQLPREQRRRGIWLGTGAAMVLRIAFAAAIVYLLMIPLLKLAGSLMLLWIAIKLLVPEARARATETAARRMPARERCGPRFGSSSSPTP